MRGLYENPFGDHKPRKPGVAPLVGAMFGPAAQHALEKQIGKEKPMAEVSQEDWGGGDLEMSAKEKERMNKKKEKRIWSRDQYVAWAEETGLDEKWVDETFVFQSDGTTIVEGDLDLGERGLTRLPRGLYRVGGSLKLYSNQLTSLEDLPKEIGDYLSLSDNQLTSLEGMPKVIRGGLSLSGNQLTSLEDLPKEIGGDLFLKEIPATSIPEGLGIAGNVYIDGSNVRLVEDARKKGYETRL